MSLGDARLTLVLPTLNSSWTSAVSVSQPSKGLHQVWLTIYAALLMEGNITARAEPVPQLPPVPDVTMGFVPVPENSPNTDP